jgi:CubicO group peptidase (beta-lactamase class C family)
MRLCSLILLATCFCGTAQEAARMDQVVQAYVADHRFMGTVLVARGGEVLLSKGYGYANLEWNMPNAPDTKFRLGSITKQFTAASILLLEERGKLHVNDPVKKYMSDAPAAWDKITIFHLLTHTSGIPDVTAFPDFPKTEPFAATTAEVVARFRDKPLEFEPGEKMKYDNSGYILLGYLIEKITGGSYEKFVRENIFAPLGMNDSGYDSNSAVIAHHAAGYARRGGQLENAGFVHMSIPGAAGGLYSTTEDLLKWEQALFGGKVLQAGSLEKMTTPYKNFYAFGLMVTTADGRRLIQHGGGIEGFNTQLSYYPDDKVTVAVLSNVEGPAAEDLAGKMGTLAFGGKVTLNSERQEITLDAKAMERLVGTYRMPDGRPMAIALDGRQLTAKLGDQPAAPIFPESETLFFAKVADAQFEFPQGEAAASQLTLHQNGRNVVAKRMDETATSALEKRVKDQTPMPGSEAALRRMIEELRAGKPDYKRMGPELAAATRESLKDIQAMVKGMGAVQSVTFKSVGRGGADVYEVKFDHGLLEWRISLGADGKVESANVRTL